MPSWVSSKKDLELQIVVQRTSLLPERRLRIAAGNNFWISVGVIGRSAIVMKNVVSDLWT